MLISFNHTCHLSILKWKQGESTALSTARMPPERMIPLFDMLPAGDFDHEKQRPLSPTEHIRLFGQRLRDRWGQRVAFVDALMIDDELHKRGLTRHPLTELLERARLARALALPVTSIGRSNEYQTATRRFVENNPGLPVCFRLTSTDLDSNTFPSDLNKLIGDVSCKPSQTFVVLDFKDQSSVSEARIDEFVELLQERINELPFLHDWLGLALALTSFPAIIKLKPEAIQEYPRTDLLAYGRLLLDPNDLLRIPMFGDYALDTSPLVKPQRRTPSAHLRYSTPKHYVVLKGYSVKTHGYEAIHPVADALVGRPDFMGRDYSEGDHFIGRLADRTSSPGHAANWRWASTDHHLTMNFRAINSFFGIVEPEKVKSPSQAETQGLLFPELSSPSTAPAHAADELADANTKS